MPGRPLYKIYSNKARDSVNSMVSHSLTALTENSRATPVPDLSGFCVLYNFGN
jgi:hypothetical protein